MLGTGLGICQVPVNLYYLISHLPWESGVKAKPTLLLSEAEHRCQLCRSECLWGWGPKLHLPPRLGQNVGEDICIFTKEPKEPRIASPNLSGLQTEISPGQGLSSKGPLGPGM